MDTPTRRGGRGCLRPVITGWRRQNDGHGDDEDDGGGWLDVEVQWEDEDGERLFPEWMSEWKAQEIHPEILWPFWARLGGRDTATGLDTYHVYRITKHQRTEEMDAWEFLTEWVGYPPTDAEWVSEDWLRQELKADELIEEYIGLIGGDLGLF